MKNECPEHPKCRLLYCSNCMDIIQKEDIDQIRELEATLERVTKEKTEALTLLGERTQEVRALEAELEGWHQGYLVQEQRAEAAEARIKAYEKASLQRTDREARLHRAEARIKELEEEIWVCYAESEGRNHPLFKASEERESGDRAHCNAITLSSIPAAKASACPECGSKDIWQCPVVHCNKCKWTGDTEDLK